MIRMTKVTDYGFILLTYMAAMDVGGVYNARDLAQTTHLPLPMVSKILKCLARGGILTSHRGVKGGYTLARDPRQIQALQIVTALEGPIAITECIGETPESPGDGQCMIEMLCPIRVNWQRINQAVRGALEEISLEDMTQPLRVGNGTANSLGVPPSGGAEVVREANTA
jgi:FeS assembly SUF system regulator